jgi:hypothetical protein
VVVVLVDEFGGVVAVVVVVFVFVVSLVSFVFSVVGFTTVVLCSTFFSGAGDVPGATTVVSFCSQAPRSAALAKMQNSFFIRFWIGCPFGTLLNRIA